MKRKLFVISVDSLFFDDVQWLTDCPNLYGIYRRGSVIQKMLSTYPAMTYVAHSTMMTGCHEEMHGIYHNEKVEVGVKHPAWHWYRRELGTQTIFDAAKKGGYSISVINWPVTGTDPSIDYLIPEIWSDNPEGDSRPRFMAVCSEGMDQLYDKYSHMLRWKYQPELDDFGVACLKDIIRDHEPDVIMLHLSYLDHARHNYGGFAPEAKHALLECDRKIGGLMDILREKGLLEQYNFCVMGDHGHLPVKQVFNPNILLVSEGLIELDDEGRVKDYECYIHSAGLSAHVVLKNPGNEAVRHRVEHLLDSWVDTESYGCEQIFNKQQMKGLHLAGPFDYVIEGRLGTSFGNSCTGQLICPIDNSDYKLSVSAHGHLPIKGPQPIFFAAGPDIRENVVVERGNLIDEAPTYAAILGVEMPWAQGAAMTEILKHANGGNEM